MLDGFVPRFQLELERLCPDGREVKVHALDRRDCGAWIGAAKLGEHCIFR